MATSFNTGFKLGTDMFTQAQRNSLAQEELALAKGRDARAAELQGLNVAALNRAAGREADQDRISGQIRDFSTGMQRPETNAALDADFQAADQASMQGLKMPAVRGGSNMTNQESLAVRSPVDVNSPEYRSGIAGLRQQFALSKGDMADFDRVGEAERKRFTDKDDADYVLDLQKNPTGDSARQARSFINAQSKKLSSKVDPKTGMTTFAMVNGDGYDEIKVSPADLSKVAVGFRRLERGDVGGLDVIAGVNKDLAAVAREELKIDLDFGKTNNDAASKAGRLAIDKEELGIKRGTAAATNEYYKNRGTTERMGAAQYFTGADGNTYASVPTQGKNGLTFQTVKVNPEGVKLNKVGGLTGPAKPVEAPEQGKIMMRDGQRYMTDGLGGEIEVNARGKALGVMPGDRDNFVTKTLGMTPVMANEMEYSKDGRYILAPNGAEYDTQDPADMKRIKSDVLAFTAQDPIEYERRMLASRYPAPTGIGPKMTFRPAEGAPSIYAGPEAWAAYRAKQQQQQK